MNAPLPDTAAALTRRTPLTETEMQDILRDLHANLAMHLRKEGHVPLPAFIQQEKGSSEGPLPEGITGRISAPMAGGRLLAE